MGKFPDRTPPAAESIAADFPLFVEYAPYGVFAATPDGRYTYVNEMACRITGYPAEELLSMSFTAIIAEDSLQAAKEHFSAVKAKGRAEGVFRLIRKDGEVKWASIDAVRISDEKFLGFVKDVSESVMAQEELKRKQELYQSYIENSHEAIYCTSFEQPIDTALSVESQIDRIYEYAYMGECNEAMARMYGLASREDLKGKRLQDFHGGRDNPVNRDTFRKFIEAGYRSHDLETEEVAVDGHRRYFISNDIGVVEDGMLLRIWGTAVDITDRKKALKALSESERKYRLLAENLYDVIWLMDAVEQKFLYISPSITRASGFMPNEIVGGTLESFLSPRSYEESKSKIAKRIPEFLAGKSSNISFVNVVEQIRKDGTFFPTEVSTYLTKDEDSGRVIIVGVSRDITERVRAEEEKLALNTKLSQSQKMEAIGTLAGGIAHDFNNILGSILGFAELTISSFAPGSEERENLQEILVASHRARDLVQQILAFSRQSDKTTIPVEMHSSVAEAMKLIGSVIPKTVKIEQHIDHASGHVMADPTEIHQIVVNLCTNAYQAMGSKGGTLVVGLNETNLGPLDADRLNGLIPGDYLRLDIVDNGPGMDESIQGKIFEPYFTTKEKGKGTGLGLAIVHGIITKMAGTITVKSKPGVGTTFSVYLPKHLPTHGNPAPEAKLSVENTIGTVLLVDDEPSLTKLGKKMLEKIGLTVRTANDPLQGLAMFAIDPEGFDIIVTDQTMPNMTGLELIAEVKRIRSDIPAIICTGFSDLIDSDNTENLGISTIIPKPYDKNTICNAVNIALTKANSR